MKGGAALAAVLVLAAAAWCAAELLQFHFFLGVILPYTAVMMLLVGIVVRVVRWACSAVPFKIPTTGGQQKSLPWIKAAPLDNPSSTLGVIGRMLLEVFCFRSLFRGARTERQGENVVFASAKWLWFFGLVFHWSFFIIVLRHLRFFLEPVPAPITGVEWADAFFQIGLPVLYLTDVLFVAALTFLFIRRVVVARIRYISLFTDYYAIILIIAIALSGILMRYVFKVDMLAVKKLTLGLIELAPVVPEGIGAIFYVHLALVCVLLIYFPWSKLMHAPGILMSPTRTMANDSRSSRHINPWNYPVAVHTYDEYEDDYREKMIKAGLPVEKGGK
jgi:nitrate reductase gamma subunit